MHQNYHFILMLSQMLVHVSAHQHHHQGAHDSHRLLLSVHYRKNNGILSEVAPISNFAQWM
jgi:hypothetical protein